ncbi:speckle-type POZ protein [Caerostris extrusa]|uniref:Speckle-type POZ protein n=1 Tax=Caerostris extrusa TaxID=172846 RepID=A0AAV4TD13_CAEEX|nr:speckle-type POZ protein [Caerostris extrusa]
MGIQTKWTLRLYPRYQDFVNVNLSRDDTDGPEFVQLQYSFELLSKNEVIKKTPSSSAQFRKTSCYTHHELINCDELFLYKRSEYLPSDILTVRCILWNADEEYVRSRCDPALSDMKLRTETETFQVHAAVLSARSPVFRAMLTTDMKEKNNCCVDIPDVDNDTLRQMILYMYTDQLEYLNGKMQLCYTRLLRNTTLRA